MTRVSNIPELRIEQYALGELSADQRQELEDRVGVEALALRVAAIQDSNAAVLAKMPPRRFAAAVEQRTPAPAPRWWMAVVPATAILAAMLIVPRVIDSAPPTPGPSIEQTRQKGVPGLHLHQQAASGARFLERGDTLAAGDVVQLSYAAAGAEFGAVVSVDGNGMITWHLPRHGSRAVKLNTGTVPLDHSYELDDAPTYERFVFITGPASFELGAIEQALDGWDGGALDLDPMLSATVFDVRKAEEVP